MKEVHTTAYVLTITDILYDNAIYFQTFRFTPEFFCNRSYKLLNVQINLRNY
jgi:hypothetical protein